MMASTHVILDILWSMLGQKIVRRAKAGISVKVGFLVCVELGKNG